MNKKNIFFDLNGVLIKSEYLSDRFEKKWGIESKVFIKALNEVMEVVRRPGLEDSFPLWNKHFEEWNLEISKEDFFDFWFSGESIDSEALEYTKDLKERGYKLFIASNNFKERTEFYRENFKEVFENFDGVYFSWETGLVKPNKEVFLSILKENSINPEDVIYFDDSESNIEIAKEMGMNTQVWDGLDKAKEYINNLEK